jgi:phosphoribosyl 1,2-cyclic phosphate phosphodiesterase
MKLLFLGTGTSTGVPQIGCHCKVCQSTDTKNKRLRSSALLTVGDTRLLFDCGPDFRQQALRHNIGHVTAILLTHEHYDHVAGLDEIRPMRKAWVYAEKRVLQVVQRSMPYIFADTPYPGAPTIYLHEINPSEKFFVDKVEIQPIRMFHDRLPVLGFRIASMAYLTDFSRIDEADLEKLKGLDVLVVDALRQFPHPAHFMLSETLELIKKIQPKVSYLMHLSHDMGLHEEVQATLPPNVFIAYDGLQIKI